MNGQDVDQKVNQALQDPAAAVKTANYIAIFTLFILQDILIHLTVNPLTNFNNIIAVTNSIANLNASIKPIQ